MKRKILILGSTGSIGTQTLAVVRNLRNDLKVVGLAINSNVDLLLRQIREFKPSYIFIANNKAVSKIRKSDLGKTKLLTSITDLTKLNKVDLVVNALSGSSGIVPTVEAIKAKKDIALANKESLVAAGGYIMRLARKYKVNIYPIDSEHSAIWQCLRGECEKEVNKILLTCSGGPFRGKKLRDLKNITVEQALKHPNWDMGGKITIDSSTLMNKGLEVIEAYHLFDVEKNQIEVVIHPQSIIHSMVEFRDGSIKAQLGPPDMRVAIQYALTYPLRKKLPVCNFDIKSVGHLDFKEPDLDTFPCLSLAYDALKVGGTMPAVLSAANEFAVNKFLKNEIKYLDISKIIKKALDNHQVITSPSFEQIIAADKWSRKFLRNV